MALLRLPRCIMKFYSFQYYIAIGGLVAQAVRRSPPTAGVPSSRLGSSMRVSWWTKRGLGRFLSGFLPFSPTTNFIPPFLHTHFIHFVWFQQPLWWCVRRGRPAPLLFTDLQYRGFIASHPSTRPCVGHELRIFFIYYYYSFSKVWWVTTKLTEQRSTLLPNRQNSTISVRRWQLE